MRLGQLARKLDLETNVIIKFLKKNNIEVENHLNTKLEDDTVEFVLNAFKPKEVPVLIKTEVEKEEPIVPIEEELTPVVDMIEENEEEVTQEIIEEEIVLKPIQVTVVEQSGGIPNVLTVSELRKAEEIESEKTTHEEKKIIEFSREDKVPEGIDVAVIRAPKIELQGIKVLGKIELPEKHKKDIKSSTDASVNEETTETTEIDSNENTTVSKELKHPNKKKLATKKIIVPDSEIKKEDKEPQKPKKAKEIKAEKKAKEKGYKKHKPSHIQEEQSERQKTREKRKKQREKQKDSPNKSQKSWLRQLWDAIK